MIYYEKIVVAYTNRVHQIVHGHYKEAPMPHPRILPLLLISCLTAHLAAQKLVLSTTATTYTSEENIWLNLSVLDADALPGAYTITVGYNASLLTFQHMLSAETGPFTVTPAASAQNGTVTVAGFQGIADTGTATASLATLVFVPAAEQVTIDSSSFSVRRNEVFSARAQEMQLSVVREMTSVLLPPVKNRLRQQISLNNGYLRFTVLNDGPTSVRIFDLGGRTVAVPLPRSDCKAGVRAVPVGMSLGSGIYIVTVRGAGLNAAKRLEVVK